MRKVQLESLWKMFNFGLFKLHNVFLDNKFTILSFKPGAEGMSLWGPELYCLTSKQECTPKEVPEVGRTRAELLEPCTAVIRGW